MEHGGLWNKPIDIQEPGHLIFHVEVDMLTSRSLWKLWRYRKQFMLMCKLNIEKKKRFCIISNSIPQVNA